MCLKQFGSRRSILFQTLQRKQLEDILVIYSKFVRIHNGHWWISCHLSQPAKLPHRFFFWCDSKNKSVNTRLNLLNFPSVHYCSVSQQNIRKCSGRSNLLYKRSFNLAKPYLPDNCLPPFLSESIILKLISFCAATSAKQISTLQWGTVPVVRKGWAWDMKAQVGLVTK